MNGILMGDNIILCIQGLFNMLQKSQHVVPTTPCFLWRAVHVSYAYFLNTAVVFVWRYNLQHLVGKANVLFAHPLRLANDICEKTKMIGARKKHCYCSKNFVLYQIAP